MISPIDITAPVQKLINYTGSEYLHEMIPVKPETTAKTGDFYNNVKDKIASDGGNIVYGWAVWQGEFTCEGKYHAVWENRDGELIDVTPQQTDTLLFIPDDRFEDAGEYIASKRVNITANPLVDHFIILSEMKDYLKSFAKQVDDENIHFNTYTGNMYNHYDALLNNITQFLKDGGKMGSPCYCQSSKPYSKCHGRNLLPAIEVDKKNAAKVNE